MRVPGDLDDERGGGLEVHLPQHLAFPVDGGDELVRPDLHLHATLVVLVEPLLHVCKKDQLVELKSP